MYFFFCTWLHMAIPMQSPIEWKFILIGSLTDPHYSFYGCPRGFYEQLLNTRDAFLASSSSGRAQGPTITAVLPVEVIDRGPDIASATVVPATIVSSAQVHPVSSTEGGGTSNIKELELELIQPHMAQKPVLRGEVGCACVAREVSVERGGIGERGCARRLGGWVGVGVKPIRACLCLWSQKERLAKLENLKRGGIITESEYQAQRQAIIQSI